MHPLVLIVPATALVFGPRLWVRYVLTRYDREEQPFNATAGALAREFLDRHELHDVKVEATDIGDHYDHRDKAVRLHRTKIDTKTLTAVTAAAHEVAHAIQDASGYGPFVWRTRLAKVTGVAVEAGTVMLLAIPVMALALRRPVPPALVGTAAVAVLGAGFANQLAALPSELDASFGRALPLLRDSVVDASQVKDVKKILVACSLTYIASSLAAVLSLWPWLGRAPLARPGSAARLALVDASATPLVPSARTRPGRARQGRKRPRRRAPPGLVDSLVRQVGKPLIRGWLRIARDLHTSPPRRVRAGKRIRQD
jgi:Zn-dependent membrane protease YugP